MADVTSDTTSAAVEPALTLKNDLAASSSPYLRAHKDNPVAWQEWSSNTIQLAKTHERLIFLSIGYSACHWCHVMEKESFSSPEVAKILNTSFIPVKLDRESRPDLDDIYMNYVTATTGSGGWPLNVFLTPSLQPVFGGTYWPGPSSTTVAPAGADEKPLTFLDIIQKMQNVWQNERERCLRSAADITRQLQAFAAEGIYAHSSVHVKGVEDNDPMEPLDLDLIDDALDHFKARYDPQHGGFIVAPNAPKFATPTSLTFLLRIGASINRPSTHTRFGFPSPIPAILGKESCASAASMAFHTLLSISRSALRDQLGHGFHRYSVTPDWNLPHFEKLTCENAQLLSTYCDAWALGRDPEILGTIYDLVEYFTDPASPIVRPEGGWYSSEDADSTPVPTQTPASGGHDEKKEGAFYVWTSREFHSILGDHDAAILARHFGVKEDGNVPAAHDVNDDFLRQNVLHVSATPSILSKEFGVKESEIVKIIKNGKAKLKEHRDSKRGKPDVDDKVIVSWNGLVISALSRAATTLTTIDEGRARKCKEAAVKAVALIKEKLFNPKTGRLTRIWGSTATSDSTRAEQDVAFIDDYAYLSHGLVKLYDSTLDQSYLEFAFALQKTMDRDFYAGSHGGYFQAAKSELTDEKGIRSPSTLSPTLAGQQTVSGTTQDDQPRPADQILNLKPGTDNALLSPNGVIAQNLLYLASYASSLSTSIDASVPTSEESSAPAPISTRSEELKFRAKKTIDAFAPEIIQHPFLYVTLLGAVVLDTVEVKSLLVPASMTDTDIEVRTLRGFGRTVVRMPQPSSSSSTTSGIIKPGEVMVCTKGTCRLLQDGELENMDEYIDEDEPNEEAANQKQDAVTGSTSTIDTTPSDSTVLPSNEDGPSHVDTSAAVDDAAGTQIGSAPATTTTGFPKDDGKPEVQVDQETKEHRERLALAEDEARRKTSRHPPAVEPSET